MLNFKEFLKLDEHLAMKVLPSTTKKSEIKLIERNKNPIFILLADGTKLYLSWDEFKRIHGSEPEIGKTLTVSFQRLEHDRTSSTSKINSIACN